MSGCLPSYRLGPKLGGHGGPPLRKSVGGVGQGLALVRKNLCLGAKLTHTGKRCRGGFSFGPEFSFDPESQDEGQDEG